MTEVASSPLADRTWRRLFAAQVIALLGTGATTIALALLAEQLTGARAGEVLGFALALKMIAYVGIAPVIGGIAHRLPRRGLLVGLDCARAAMVFLLPFVDAVWQIYLLVFLLNACSAGFTPVFQAVIPDILRNETTYTRALSLSRLAYDLENLLSPVLAVALLAATSFHVLFVLNGAAFLISAGLVMSVTLPVAAAPQRARGLGRDIAYGMDSYLRTPRLRSLLALSLAVAAAGAMVIVNSVVLVTAMGRDPDSVATLFLAFGAGSMLVAIATPLLLEPLRDRTLMLAGGMAMAMGLLPVLALPGWGWLLLLWFVIGAGSSAVQTPAGRLLRRSSAGEDRSALFSAHFALSHACWLLCYPLAGWLGGNVGLGVAAAVLAVIAGASTLGARHLWPRDDPEIIEHRHVAMRHEHLHRHDEHHQHDHEGWEGPEPHRHPHAHAPLRHAHAFVIDYHHRQWP